MKYTMLNIDLHTISASASLFDALHKLNALSSTGMMALFVRDENEAIVGTITDGDIRRAILSGVALDANITTISNENFVSIDAENIDVAKIKDFRTKGYKLIPVLDQCNRLIHIINFNKYRSYLPVDAVLMAGGKGERLRPMTLQTPKPLLKVGGKPIIDYNVDNVLMNGIDNVNVTVNYLKEQIEEHFNEPYDNRVQIKCIREPKFLGTMGSVKFIKELVNDTILIMNSDLFTNIDIENFYLHFKEHDADMSVAAVPYTVNVPYGIFEISDARDIKGVKEKPSYHYYANAGIYLIKRKLIDLIPDETCFNATDMIELLISQNKRVIRFPLAGYWIDIGKPDDFNKVQDIAKHLPI